MDADVTIDISVGNDGVVRTDTDSQRRDSASDYSVSLRNLHNRATAPVPDKEGTTTGEIEKS